MIERERYIYVAPNGDGRWKVFGDDGQTVFTEELFPTMKTAIRAVPGYAKLLGWERGSYFRSVDA